MKFHTISTAKNGALQVCLIVLTLLKNCPVESKRLIAWRNAGASILPLWKFYPRSASGFIHHRKCSSANLVSWVCAACRKLKFDINSSSERKKPELEKHMRWKKWRGAQRKMERLEQMLLVKSQAIHVFHNSLFLTGSFREEEQYILAK